MKNALRRLHYWMAGKGDEQRLPQQVVDSIHQQQDASEILIGWIQLLIVVTFGVLYAISPKAFVASSFTPVPWFLGLYFLFTVMRLWVAHARSLPFWFLVASVIVDMVLLMGLIWSFHLQYNQPPSFYLKAPTLLYVFIFIALRALRFEPGFVVLSGLVAAAGWAFMLIYAIDKMPPSVHITRDYILYMTSNNILAGAEIDKIISILVVTLILTIAIIRARRLLVQAAREHNTVDGLSRFVPNKVVEDISSQSSDNRFGESEVREATILFADLEQFTAIGKQLKPEELVMTLNEYFTAIVAPVRKYGGVINQFQGDAILASFNLPDTTANHAEMAVKSAIEIQQVLARSSFCRGNLHLKARIGINTGTVVGGLVGTPDRLNYTVHGDVVNLAARLEQLNKKTGTRILLTHKTRQQVQDKTLLFIDKGRESIRGHHRPVQVYTVEELPKEVADD
ncbi:MAG TPA: adenylate/guanylate cyclase domain-containing protein [Gammaproteobacteria bacterium]|nr:adenylate/guanylate cyclase domain-containing protein [Gammaproteobacteria bacterium]